MMQHFFVRIVHIRTSEFRPCLLDILISVFIYMASLYMRGLLEDVQTNPCNEQLWSESDTRMKWTRLMDSLVECGGRTGISLPAEHNRS